MLIEPEASSSMTSRSGFSLRCRLTRLIGTPPWLILLWMVRAQIEPVAAPPRQIAAGQPRAHGLCQPRRDGVGLLDLLGVGHLAEIDFRKIVGARGAFHAALAGAVFAAHRRSRESGPSRPRLPTRSDLLSCRLFSDGLLAALVEPMVTDRDLTRLPSQNASNSPSNFSQSDFRAENRCLNAERSSPGLSA